MTGHRPRGVDAPTIRPSDTDRHPSVALVLQAVETAHESLDALERESREVARRLRRHAVGEAQQGLARLFQLTQSVLRLADMTAAATGTSLVALCDTAHLSAPADTDAVVSRLIREQMAGNWFGVAAALDRPFVSALTGWRDVFDALMSTTGPHGTAA